MKRYTDIKFLSKAIIPQPIMFSFSPTYFEINYNSKLCLKLINCVQSIIP